MHSDFGHYDFGGFAEDETAVDGDWKAFNYYVALEYYNALLDEAFELVGDDISYSFFDELLKWLNIYNDFKEEELLKSGKILTTKNRTLIDAIYENNYGTLAEIYLTNGVYDPKLLFALIICDHENFTGYALLDSDKLNNDEIDILLTNLYDLIEENYIKEDDKETYLRKIYKNIGRIRTIKGYKMIQPTEYQFYKDMKKMKNIDDEDSAKKLVKKIGYKI
ncbi:MAG: hypothetical protein E7170_04220 [Firmicutes bacterium]|nr:hypothetical protein [Bacillota bacterium]